MDLFLSTPYIFFALAAGTLFGFLLRKATVSRFDVIVGQLLLRDFTVMKVILTAIVTGSIGIYFCQSLGWIPTLHLSKVPVLWTMLGGSLFGVGMAVTGYCPGTALAALGEGSKDMIFGLAGLLVGAALFNELYPFIRDFIEQKDLFFQQTFATFFHLPNYWIISILVMLWIVFFVGMKFQEKRELARR